MRLNYYINEYVVLRSYYRHYADDWGIDSNTLQFELPIRLNLSWKLTPIYRFYNQTAANYFAPYNAHSSTQDFYTSDYDLSKFTSHQWGMSIGYRAVLSKLSIADFGLKSAQLRHNNTTVAMVYRPLLCLQPFNLFWINSLYLCDNLSKFVRPYFQYVRKITNHTATL